MIDPIAFKLGPFAVHWYALCILSGLLLAVYLASKEAPRKGISSDDIIDFIIMAFPLSILGARIYYVIFEWSYYSQHPGDIFAIWNGGIAIYGGLLTGLCVLWIYSYYKAINPFDFLDIAVPGVMIAQSIGRWGNFINQEAYGKVVSKLDYLPGFIQKQMFIDGHYRQPTFLYESLWNLLGFIVILVLRRRPRFLKEGEIMAFYLIWYGFGRLIVEGMRTDSLMFLGIRVSQLVSLILIIVGIVFIVVRRKYKEIPYYQK
ncbi:prolipoprotein diacylglyceryl transferase [Streptococcus didelphis]|uniref:Phosphatidylglycerol--prolipoprotein diacylglyceryl transferase n=1 Tax=Streptococcus didelphis TaxID=102886 RepID=A0ABY9LJU5_9STRE|nr:prolipoprotein diacylglyceryl transferase [Streptococcus didelphis]WMB28455.1 prolipoprotein diacylglyceryl transferase [Streptococcus didelphis]WMB29130.1 prolipoprotein diacylglyceryl transferase [Streptococcus didelphis]